MTLTTTYFVRVDYLTRHNVGTYQVKVEANSEAAAIDLAVCACKFMRNPLKITSTHALARHSNGGKRGAYR